MGMPAVLFGLRIYTPKAAPALPLIRMTNTVEVVFYQDVSTEIIPKIVKREDALFVIPANVAAKLYLKTPDLRLVGITSIGMLAILTTNQSYQDWKDVDAKEVYIGAPGSSPDTVSRVLFRTFQVKPNIVYGDSPQIAQFMIAGKIENAVLPEPLVSLVLAKNSSVRVLKYYREEWEKVFSTRSGVPQTAIVAFAGFLEKNKSDIVAFFQQYQREVQWVNQHPAEASKLGVVGLGLTVPEAVIERAIPKMGLTYLPARLARQDILLYLRELMKVDQESVGQIPDEKFFAW